MNIIFVCIHFRLCNYAMVRGSLNWQKWQANKVVNNKRLRTLFCYSCGGGEAVRPRWMDEWW